MDRALFEIVGRGVLAVAVLLALIGLAFQIRDWWKAEK